MPSIFNFIQRVYTIPWGFKRSESDIVYPNNLVRLCKSRAEFINIINEAINSSDRNWDKQLVDRVICQILDGESSGVSVYRVDTLDPLDHGHALAVMAEGMSQNNFRSNQRKRRSSCTRGSLIIPTDCLPSTTKFEFTPKNNLNFHPANSHHFDLTIDDIEEFAVFLLNGISRRTIAWSLLGNEKPFEGSYRLQASIAYSYCPQTFGKLDPSSPPTSWLDGSTITASEQIDTLKYLAQTTIVDSPKLPL